MILLHFEFNGRLNARRNFSPNIDPKKVEFSLIVLREGSEEKDPGNVQTKSNNEVQEVDGTNHNGLQLAIAAETEVEIDEETAEEIENINSSESEAPISERAASGFSDSPTVGSPRVQFEKIKEEDGPSAQTPEVPTDAAPPSGLHEEDRKCRRHQKHEHK